MSEIRQEAGSITMSTWTDGYPHWVKIEIYGVQMPALRLSDLHDIRYAADRMIAKMAEAGCKP